MLALESQQRKITISERDSHVAKEEAKDVNRKLNDQLYLGNFIINIVTFFILFDPL